MTAPSFIWSVFPVEHSVVDLPVHVLSLAAKHRFLLIAAAIGAPFILPKKFTGLAWLFVLLNIVVGTDIAAYVLAKVGVSGPAQITSAFSTSTVYNNHFVVGYNVQIRTAGGKIVETSFEDDDFNQYPLANTFVVPQPGDKFNVRYLPTFPRDFVIVTNDDSPWARGLACNALEQNVLEAERKYEFADRSQAYRAPYIDAIEAAIAGGCYDHNADILQAYRGKIDEVKAGRE